MGAYRDDMKEIDRRFAGWRRLKNKIIYTAIYPALWIFDRLEKR